MSIILPAVDLSTAVVGTTGSVSWEQQAVRGSIPQIHTVGNGAVQVYNESGCGIKVQLHQSGETSFIPAGGWRQIALDADDVSIDYTVLYIIPNAPVTTLIVVYYKPAEAVDELGILGNSPIGITGALPTSVTQVIQDAQATGGTIVESTPTGLSQTILMTTDGRLKLAGNVSPVYLWRGTVSAADKVVFEAFPTDVAQAWEWIYRTTGNFDLVEAISGVNALGLLAGGGVRVVGGQASTGNLGVPVIVAQAIDVNVITTTFQTLLTYAVTTTGVYRISTYISLNNGTNGNALTVNIVSTDPDTSVAAGQTPTAYNPSTSAINALVGVATWGNSNIAPTSQMVRAKTGTNITCMYQDPTNTPNDHVSFIIERLQ